MFGVSSGGAIYDVGHRWGTLELDAKGLLSRHCWILRALDFERSGGVALVVFLVYVASKDDRDDAEFKTEGHSLGHGKYIGDNVMAPMSRSDMTMT